MKGYGVMVTSKSVFSHHSRELIRSQEQRVKNQWTSSCAPVYNFGSSVTGQYLLANIPPDMLTEMIVHEGQLLEEVLLVLFECWVLFSECWILDIRY